MSWKIWTARTLLVVKNWTVLLLKANSVVVLQFKRKKLYTKENEKTKQTKKISSFFQNCDKDISNSARSKLAVIFAETFAYCLKRIVCGCYESLFKSLVFSAFFVQCSCFKNWYHREIYIRLRGI